MAIEEVANGRADAATVSNTALKEAVDKGLPVKSIGSYGQPDVDYGYAVRKEDSQLQDTLNEGLKRLKASPYWDELVKKWDMK
jgi:polar amino acid transport system substrate-binding protein